MLRDQIGGSAGVIMHQSYADYETIKHGSRSHSGKESTQRQIFSNPQHVFAVGPLLFTRLSDIRKDAIQIMPGLYDMKPDVPTHNLVAAVIGRLDHDNSLMKGAPLACHGIAEAVRRVRDAGVPSSRLSHPILKLIGVSGELQSEAKDIRSEIEQVAEQCISVSIQPFLSRKELREELRTVNLCFMLSWHEGFGLVGWEAIGAGIPLIVSKNSGLYRTLEDVGMGASGCVYGIDLRGSLNASQPFRQEDLDATAKAVAEIASRLEKWIEKTEYLRHLLVARFTWDDTARTVLKEIGSPYRPRKSEEPVRGAYVAFTEGLDEARNREKLQIAKVLYETGYYERALEEVRMLGSRQLSPRVRDEQRLLECEVILRLNRHIEAKDFSEQLVHEFVSSQHWTNVIVSMGILNTALRALGDYKRALDIAKRSFEIAVEHCPAKKGKACRDVARCIALLGGPEKEGLQWAHLSLDLASNNLEKAKCFLAIGEVFRHTNSAPRAVDAYSESVGWASAVGHYDCLLWAALGLADSQFLLAEYGRAEESLSKVRPIIEDADRRFPLESLHYQLSRSSLDFISRDGPEPDWESLVISYEELGVTWPREYIAKLREREHKHAPKRF